MNIYLIIGGALATIGGFAHAFLGHKWTIQTLSIEHIGGKQNTGDQNRRYLTWWWHIGSVFLISSGALFFSHGAGVVEVHSHLLNFLSFMWISTTTIFIVLAAKKPYQFLKMAPGAVGVPINILILLGLCA